MSARLFPDDVLFEQRLLRCAGFYEGELDGQYGPKTLKAEERAAERFETLKRELGAFDPRSEKNIASLLPDMQRKARQILKVAKEREKSTGLRAAILSGTRTYDEQIRLYKRRPKVTNASAGQSWHNFGMAIDIGLFEGMRYLTGAQRGDNDAYKALAKAIKSAVSTIEWGGDWKSFVDLPHYQYATGKTITQVRKLFERGEPFT